MAKVGGRTEKIYVPFAVLTGMVMDNDVFSNVEVSSGKVINDGERTVVAGMALPGLADNLNVDSSDLEFFWLDVFSVQLIGNLHVNRQFFFYTAPVIDIFSLSPGLADNLNVDSSDLELPDYVEVTADVDKFEMTNTVTVADSSIFADLDNIFSLSIPNFS